MTDSRETPYGPADCEDTVSIDFEAMDRDQLDRANNINRPKLPPLPEVEYIKGPDPELLRQVEIVKRRMRALYK